MKAFLVVLLAAVTVGGVVVLREATMTRHTPVDPRSEMELVLHASSNVAEANLDEMVEALFVTCQLQVATNPTGRPTPLGGDTYLLGMRPALDGSDQRQLVGCLEDAVLDRLQASVLSISESGAHPSIRGRAGAASGTDARADRDRAAATPSRRLPQSQLGQLQPPGRTSPDS